MIDPTEVAMLHAISHSTADLPRLVYADWLEEHGNAARAEFIRVQCELHSTNLAEPYRNRLLLRERDLLNSNRSNWCEVSGVPLEDVVFDRGLISAARIVEWDGGAFLDPAVSPHFMNVQELDLSGLRLENKELMTFSNSAELPNLRKLMLNNNRIDDYGAQRLARARLKRLDTLYLFHSSVTRSGRGALLTTANFRLKSIDLGEHEDGYSMSGGQTEMGRRRYIRTQLLPHLEGYFQKYPLLQSAMLCVAQYWNDEADDAVHNEVIVSELYEPTIIGAIDYLSDDVDGQEDPNVPNTIIVDEHGVRGGSRLRFWSDDWDDNTGAIPLWAAYSGEDGHQGGDISEVYNPAVIFYRHGGYRFLPMVRQHLDGIRPEWENED